MNIKRKGYIFALLFIIFVMAAGTQVSAAGASYKITYKLNKGTNSSKNPKVYKSTKSKKLYKPTRTGYTFKGWYTDKKYANKITKIKKGTTGNLQLYAKWAAKSYKITYKLNNGVNHSKNSSKYKYNKASKLYNPTRTGYTFEGWYTDKKYKNKITKIQKGTSGTVILYAKWSANTYKISYKLNGGVNNDSNPTNFKYNKSAQLYEPSKANYVFLGWYTDSGFTTKITKINKNTLGNMTLYAKWTLEPLNIMGTGTNDMIWSWWYYPQVVSYEGTANNLYWGFATSEGYCGVAAYDYATGITTKTILKKAVSIDDHNGLAVTVMRDGRIMCAYPGGHNADKDIHVRISDKAEDISNFGTDIVLESSGKTCYSQIIQYNNKYYIFYRVDNKNWAFRESADGTKWTDEKMLVTSTMQYYCKFIPTTEDGLIRVCMYSNPTSDDPNIRMGFFDLRNETLYNADAQTKLGTDNISYLNFDIIIEKPQGLTQRMFDVAVTEPLAPRILYATFSTKKTSLDSTYKLYDAGNIIEICHGGSPIWNPKYQCGASFLGGNQIALAREEDGYDKIELYDYDGTGVTLRESIYAEEVGSINIRNARPIADVNGKVFLWHRGFYSPDSYTDFYTEAKMYFLDN